jgi:predicted peroxiredoxin
MSIYIIGAIVLFIIVANIFHKKQASKGKEQPKKTLRYFVLDAKNQKVMKMFKTKGEAANFINKRNNNNQLIILPSIVEKT